MNNNPPLPTEPGPDPPGRGHPLVTKNGPNPCEAASVDESLPGEVQASDPASTRAPPSDDPDKAAGVKPGAPPPPKAPGRLKLSAEYQRQKEERRVRHEQRAEKMRLVLWPTPEAVSSMEKFIGGPIIYSRLTDSTRFMDAWSVFSKKKTPSGRDLGSIRAEAQKTLCRGSRRGRPAPKSSPEKGGTSQNRPREKSTSSASSDNPKPRLTPTAKVP